MFMDKMFGKARFTHREPEGELSVGEVVLVIENSDNH